MTVFIEFAMSRSEAISGLFLKSADSTSNMSMKMQNIAITAIGASVNSFFACGSSELSLKDTHQI